MSLNFARDTDINATNLLAANLGAEFILLGEFNLEKEFDDLAISLSHNGMPVNSERQMMRWAARLCRPALFARKCAPEAMI